MYECLNHRGKDCSEDDGESTGQNTSCLARLSHTSETNLSAYPKAVPQSMIRNMCDLHLGSDRGIPMGTQSSTHTPTPRGTGLPTGTRVLTHWGFTPGYASYPQGFYSHDTSHLCANFIIHLFACSKLLPSSSGSTVKLLYFIVITPMRKVHRDSPIHLHHLHRLVQQ